MHSRLAMFNVLSVKGEEPLRNHRKTAGVIKSRMGARYETFLATPQFSPDGRSLEWYTDVFESEPVRLSALSGAERTLYEKKIRSLMQAYRAALPEPGDDARALMQRLVIIPDEDSVFCADGRVVVTEWGLKPRNASMPGLDLLQLGEPLTSDESNESNESDERHESNNADASEPSEPSGPTDPVGALREALPATGGNFKKPDKPKQPEVIRAARQPRKSRRPRWLWLLILLGILLLAGAVWLLARSCSRAGAQTVDKMEKTTPEPKASDIVMDKDSVRYVVADRLRLTVTGGGTLDEFCEAFSSAYPDSGKYKLCSPDTILGSVMLICPSAERDNLIKEIPEKLDGFELLITTEGVNDHLSRPNDPAINDADDGYYFDMVNAIDAWDIEKGKPEVTVAILDGDIDVTHPEIKDRVKLKYDAVTRTNNIPAVPECGGHGTHTAATAVGAINNARGAGGIAPGCSLIAVNVFRPGGYAVDDDIIHAMMYAIENGADIISMSLGGRMNRDLRFLPPNQQKEMAKQMYLPEEQLWERIYRYAEDQGVLVVKSAGNDNMFTGIDPHNRSQIPLLVAAVSQDGERAIWDPLFGTGGSNFGENCRISAPGTQILNAVPRGRYDYMDGTSMSTPMVAGGAALLKSHRPGLTPAQLREILVATANPKPKDEIGPIMDLVAALQADPNHLPSTPPDNGGRLGQMPQPNPGGTLLRKLIGAPSPYAGGLMPSPFGGGGQQPGPNPYGGGGGGQQPGRPGNDCGDLAMQYKALLELRAALDRKIKEMQQDCPECLKGI